MKETYGIGLLPLKSCLINLPQSLTKSLTNKNVPAQNVVAALSYQGRTCYAGWTGHSSSESKSIEIDPAFARNLGFGVGIAIEVNLHVNPRQADAIWVEPQTASDWEIMELHASFLEVNLINQIRAVSLGHPLTLYLNNHTTATIEVKKIEPELGANETFAKVSEFAEIIVSPKTRQVTSRQSKARSVTSTKSKQKPIPRTKTLFLCVSEIDDRDSTMNAIVSPAHLREHIELKNFVKIQHILPAGLHKRPNDSVIAPPLPAPTGAKPSSAARNIVVGIQSCEEIAIGHIKLAKAVVSALGLKVGSRIRLSEAPPPIVVNKITYHPVTETSRRKELRFNTKQDISIEAQVRQELLSLKNTPLCNDHKIPGYVLDIGAEEEWTRLTSIEDITLVKGSDVVLPTIESIPMLCAVKGLDNQQNLIQKVVRRTGCVLVFGPRGSGKTVLMNECVRQAETSGRYIVRANCAQLSEERIANVKEAITLWLSEAAWHEPALVVLDDLDRLCLAEVEHADSTRARQLTEIFLSICRNFRSRHAISILATSQAKEGLHSLLTTTHLFDETIGLRAPEKLARRDILASTVQDASDVDWLEVGNMTEGYLGGDLAILTERARHEALMRALNDDSEDIPIITQDYVKAMEGFTPASLRGIKLQKSTVAWKDIGGLEETRAVLLETLEWPTRYAPIFANCPLRLRSGLLLYGYPGCGKTLLASAVASECGLNFISVKGPEILNKYIGASEKSVRDLFDRAQAAKPCVLFFDEFDSIAPKRGHDSTGVTDRVVNQMLTQMDGAEGLDGVYVLAATSRPDLIDPALLRPGRLDKSLLCNMPTISDRESILGALANKMHLGKDVVIADLAAKTEGFSGADLQAVLYNAHLEAIHDVLESDPHDITQKPTSKEPIVFTRFRLSDKGKKSAATPATLADQAATIARLEAILEGNKPSKTTEETHLDRPIITISRANLEKSLSSTRPSISSTERDRLDKIYREFIDGRSPEGLRDGTVPPNEQRATLA